MGDHDLVRQALADAGMALDFWRIAMRPGKPLIHGRLGAMSVLGLPGNPTSATVCAILFLRPLVRALLGDPAAGADPSEPARLAAALPAVGERKDFLRATLADRRGRRDAGDADRRPGFLARQGARPRRRAARPRTAARRRPRRANPAGSSASRRSGPDRRPRRNCAGTNRSAASLLNFLSTGRGNEADGIFNAGHGAAAFGFRELAGLHWNLQAPQLYAEAIRRNEAVIAQGGALVAETGVHTGRSPKDKAIVRDAATEHTVWWEGNNAMSREHFDTLLADFIEHARGRELFAQDLYAGADPEARVRARVYTEFAWHSLFIRDLLIRPELSALGEFVPDLTIVDLPSFRADPRRHGCRSETVIACDFSRKIVLIGGTRYAGEMKKSVFTYLNFILPDVDVLPMHCSANLGGPDDVAIFFGLSGTGKTTLSAVPGRTLIGDDEHGWSREGVFNFEGGCYAKAIHLSRDVEPEIYAASEHFGVVMENVVLDPQTPRARFRRRFAH